MKTLAAIKHLYQHVYSKQIQSSFNFISGVAMLVSIKFSTDTHDPQMMNPTVGDDPLIFPLAPPAGWHMWWSVSNCRRHRHKNLALTFISPFQDESCSFPVACHRLSKMSICPGPNTQTTKLPSASAVICVQWRLANVSLLTQDCQMVSVVKKII